MENMYERIKRLRKQKGMSQEELALKCGFKGRSSITKIEKGQNDISQTLIVKISNALGVTPMYLMDGDAIPSLSNDELKLVLFGTSDISDEKLNQVLNFAAYIKEQ